MRGWGTLMRILFSSQGRHEKENRDMMQGIADAQNDVFKREAERRRDEIEQILRERDLELSIVLGRRIRHGKRSTD